ncbi:MAG: DUF1080 domain-containing protein [Verrucomicrobia bacterium]|nr:DUF1080 domain-containing protein [Verrucomicrobiota bacterium]MDA1066342.1 DUF1080 domain-containing protein [Verrucomicrobiota bacterium]
MNRSPENEHLGYSDMPVLPDSGYAVHDGTRPQPPIVSPGSGNRAPSDALVLFDGSNLEAWESVKEGGSASWKLLDDGSMEVVPGTGNIRTRESFGNIQLHLEFSCPTEINGEGQGRGNSGVFLMGLYEIQVLDNHNNPTYADGTVGAMYGQTPPLVNAIREPGQWNVYDIVWETPVFENAERKKPARITAILNGVVVQHGTELLGPTTHKALPPEDSQESIGPLMLQDHGDLVRFRNIWIRPLRNCERF